MTAPATTQTTSSEPWQPPPLSRRAELTIAAVITVVAVALVAWLTRHNWFHADVWDPLTTRELTSLDDIMRPRNGHWAVPQVVQTRLLYGAVGMEFLPLHQLPRLLGWPIVAFAAWQLMRRRGADQYVALGAYAVLLVLGTSWFLQPWFVGMGVVALALYGAAWLIADREEPSVRDQVWVFLLLTAGLMSAGTMVGVLGGTALVVLVTRQWRVWLPPVIAAGAVYAVWFLWYDVADAEGIDLTVSRLLEVPIGVARIFAATLPKVVGLPSATGPILAVLLLGYLAWLAYRGRLTRFDGIILAAVGVFLALVVIRRGVNTHDRYANDTLLWLAPVLIPLIKVPTRRWAWPVAAAILGFVLVANVVRLESGTSERIEGVEVSRSLIEAAAVSIGADEPFVPTATIDQRFARQLDARGLSRLVAEGWAPAASPERIEEARGRLRAAFVEVPSVTGGAFVAKGIGEAGCVRLRSGDEIEIMVGGSGSVGIDGARGRSLEVTWQDEFGRGHYVSERRLPDVTALEVAAPRGGVLTIVATGDGGAVELCGLSG